MPIPLISKLSFVSQKSATSTNEERRSTDSSDSLTSFSNDVHIYDKKMSFRLKEKLVPLAGSYGITVIGTDEEMFKVNGKMLSLSDQKVICDKHGNMLYKLIEAKVSLRDRMTILDKSDQPILKLRKKGVLPGYGRNTLLAFPGDTEEEEAEPVFEISGNFFKKDYLIKSGGECCATVRRKILDAGGLLIGKDCYFVDVEGGVDCALLLLLVVALDEVFRDGSGVITGGGLRGLF